MNDNHELENILTGIGSERIPEDVRQLAQSIADEFRRSVSSEVNAASPESHTPKIAAQSEELQTGDDSTIPQSSTQPAVRLVPDVPTDLADGISRGSHRIEQPPSRRHDYERIVAMLKRKTVRWSAVAAAVVIAVGTVTMLNKSVPSVYAVEQTIEAIRGLRFIHVRFDPPGFDSNPPIVFNSVGEAWVQFDDAGNLVHMRSNFPKSMDGPKDVVWDGDKAEVWFKAKKSVLVVRDADKLAGLRYIALTFDPKKKAEELLRARDAGKLQAETIMAAEGKTIKLSTPFEKNRQTVYYVDPTTKLLRYMENYKLIDGQPVLVRRMDYLDYNQPPEEDVFVLNLPEGVMRIDETTQVIGLPKGDLTDAQITVKVAREFFEALIAKDYTKAGQLYSGLPVAKMEDFFGKKKFVSIVSIGEPMPHWIPGVGGMVVSCKVQIEKDGKTDVREFKPAVRPVYSQRDRWTIHGGI